MLKNHSSQKGTALITALLLMALIAAISVALIGQTQVSIRRTETMINADQAYLASLGVEAWGENQLKNYFTHIMEMPHAAWPKILPPTQWGSMTVEGQLDDLQARLNLNNVYEPAFARIFSELLKSQDPSLSTDAINAIIAAAKGWISASYDPNEKQYTAMDPPYRSGHQSFISVSELRLIAGVTPELYQRISPYLTALPEVTPINVNTASLPLLATIVPPADVTAVMNQRSQQGGFNFIEDFFKLARVQDVPYSFLSVYSTYFLLKTHVTLGKQSWVVYSCFKLSTPGNGKFDVQVLWRSLGAL